VYNNNNNNNSFNLGIYTTKGTKNNNNFSLMQFIKLDDSLHSMKLLFGSNESYRILNTDFCNY